MERGRLQKVPLNWTCVLEILFITDLSGAGDAGWDQSYKTFFGRIFFGQSYKGFFIEEPLPFSATPAPCWWLRLKLNYASLLVM